MNNEVEKIPVVSILIPMYNEERFIESCLTSLVHQDYPSDKYEIIVIDGESTDSSASIVKKISHSDNRLKYLKNPDRITSKALNIGIRKAKGDIIVRMDAHVLAPQYYITTCVKYLLDNNVENVGGIIKTVGHGFWGKNIALATSCPFGVGNSKFRCTTSDGYDEAGWPGAFWKKTLIEVGGFDEDLRCNEDDDLNFQLLKSGKKVFRTAEIELIYFCRNSLKDLWYQYYRYGFWKVKVIQKYSKPTTIRHFIPAIFLLSILFSSVLVLIHKNFLYLFLSIIGIYSAASLCYSIYLSIKSKRYFLFSLPIVFITLHLSYGMGFILGTFQFLLLRKNIIPNSTTQ